MSKADLLQQALNKTSTKPPPERPMPETRVVESTESRPQRKVSARAGKEHIGSWMNPDFGVSLRLLQLRRRKDANGKKIYLDDLMAEAFNDLFLKYDVPTVHHE